MHIQEVYIFTASVLGAYLTNEKYCDCQLQRCTHLTLILLLRQKNSIFLNGERLQILLCFCLRQYYLVTKSRNQGPIEKCKMYTMQHGDSDTKYWTVYTSLSQLVPSRCLKFRIPIQHSHHLARNSESCQPTHLEDIYAGCVHCMSWRMLCMILGFLDKKCNTSMNIEV